MWFVLFHVQVITEKVKKYPNAALRPSAYNRNGLHRPPDVRKQLLFGAGQHNIALIDSAGNHTSVDFWVDL
ncbi:MAG: hypothetical protein IPH35_08720 [Rhodoferax sp.]|nr:hypothetical protein [Rhodoferax sp.]